jgi:GntR family transcriptional activator of glc operon
MRGVEAKQVAERVVERIERLITDGILKAGDRLPSERQLCEKFGASRTAVREGLRILRGLGILETRHGIGTVVAKLSVDRGASPLMHLFNSQPRTLYDLLEVRTVLESEAARLAAMRATPLDTINIRRRYEAMVSDSDSRDSCTESHARLDHAFHRAIYEASHNHVLVHVLQSLSDLMLSSVFASICNLYHRPPMRKMIDRHHSKLYEAIVARSPERASRAANEHIQGLKGMFAEVEQDEHQLIRAAMKLDDWK